MESSVAPLALRPTVNASSRRPAHAERHHGAAVHGYGTAERGDAAHREQHYDVVRREELAGFRRAQLFPALSALTPAAKPLPASNRALGVQRTTALRRVGAHLVQGKRIHRRNRALLGQGGARVSNRSTWLMPVKTGQGKESLVRGFGHSELRKAPA